MEAPRLERRLIAILAADAIDGELAAPAAAARTASELHVVFHCVGGRGQIDHAAASIVAFALRQSGLEAKSGRGGDKVADDDEAAAVTIDLICYASHPSDAVRRYTLRKLILGDGARQARHLVIDYDVAPAGASPIDDAARLGDTFAGDIATLCRLATQHAVTVERSLGSVTVS